MTTRVRGYASLTETPYKVGPYTEVIKRGAFNRTLSQQPDVQLLINHGGLPMARTTNGTLTLHEDDQGLGFNAELDDDRGDVEDLVRAMNRWDITQCSFSFISDEDEFNQDRTHRIIRAVDIHRGDVSIVTQGASPTTWSQVMPKSADGRCFVRGTVAFTTEAVEHTRTGLVEVRLHAARSPGVLDPIAEAQRLRERITLQRAREDGVHIERRRSGQSRARTPRVMVDHRRQTCFTPRSAHALVAANRAREAQARRRK